MDLTYHVKNGNNITAVFLIIFVDGRIVEHGGMNFESGDILQSLFNVSIGPIDFGVPSSGVFNE